MQYELIEDDWPEIEAARRLMAEDAKRMQNLPVAIETEATYLFRDIAGKIFHRYEIPRAISTEGIAKHLTHYAVLENTWALGPENIKKDLMRRIEHCLRKVSKVRTKVSFLEIGATIGENYQLIKMLCREMGLDIEIEFVGIEINRDRVQFANMLFYGDDGFQAFESDASDLSRFPDKSFDFVISQGVANLVHNQQLAFSEIVRVVRLGVILTMQVTEEPQSFYLTGGDTGYSYYIPTRKNLYDIWRRHGTLYDYTTYSRSFSEIGFRPGGSGYYLGVDNKSLPISMEGHLLTRFNMFPEWEKICLMIS